MEGLEAGNDWAPSAASTVPTGQTSLEAEKGLGKGPVGGVEVGLKNFRLGENGTEIKVWVIDEDYVHNLLKDKELGEVGQFRTVRSHVTTVLHPVVVAVLSNHSGAVVKSDLLTSPSLTVGGSVVWDLILTKVSNIDGNVTFVASVGFFKVMGLWVGEIDFVSNEVNHHGILCKSGIVFEVGFIGTEIHRATILGNVRNQFRTYSFSSLVERKNKGKSRR